MNAIKTSYRYLQKLPSSVKVWLCLVLLKVLYEATMGILMYRKWDTLGLFAHNSRVGFLQDEIERVVIGGAFYTFLAFVAITFARTQRLAIGTAITVGCATLGVDWFFADSTDAQAGLAKAVVYCGVLLAIVVAFIVINSRHPST